MHGPVTGSTNAVAPSMVLQSAKTVQRHCMIIVIRLWCRYVYVCMLR